MTILRTQKPDRTVILDNLLDLLRTGDEAARERLIEVAQRRLRTLAHDMLHGDRLHRWEQTDDVLQEASLGLHQHLADARPADTREFLALAAFHIRRALIKMARHYCGPHGMATHHKSGLQGPDLGYLQLDGEAGQASTPSQIISRSEQWMRLADALDGLPDSEREVTEMIWIYGLSRVEVARILGVAERTVRRRWQRARLMLFTVISANDSAFVRI